MSDNSNPSVFTQPGGDADDVLGHSATGDAAPTGADGAPDFRGTFDKVAAHHDDSRVDDVEGHGQDFKAMDKAAGTADFRASFDKVAAFNDDADDVEGHGQDFKAMDKAAGAADFRASFDKVAAFNDDKGDDVEGHIHTS